MSTFQISIAPEYYGSDATEEEAKKYADLIAEAARQEFPSVRFETVFSNNTPNRDADPDGEIQQWINDHWVDICS